MADEFIKGLGVLVTAGLGWMTLAGWYRTPGFEDTQLIAPPELSDPTIYDQIALLTMDVLFWFAVIGALTFWVVIPAVREARKALEGESEA
ncbi:MAG: hypothetical protein V5A61_17275 [Haloarculaceae archaeon]